MIPSDRPVIAEPVDRLPPSPPLRVRLGQVMHLNGTVPRGADLRTAIPKRCQTCGALFILFGKGSARALYCPDCRAQRCPSCTAPGGTHYASCSSLKPRHCRGCQASLGGAPKMDRYCPSCQAAPRCPTCDKVGGGHLRWCTWSQPKRVPAYYGIVTEADILALYLEHRTYAVRIAHQIVGADGEDVVQDVTMYLLEKRDYLTALPGKAYFLTAVRNGALRLLIYAWHRYVIAMDPEDLLIAEQMIARGETSQNTVRLPEPVA